MASTDGQESDAEDEDLSTAFISPELLDETVCPICLHTQESPKLLPCGHSFCYVCLYRHMESKLPTNYPPCPKCRRPITTTFYDITTLPNNILLQKVIDHVQETIAKERRPPRCSLCEKDEPLTDTCLVCGQTMCSVCAAVHAKLKPCHVTKSVEDMDQLKVEDILPLSEPECGRHSKAPLDLYCLCCESTMCVTCNVTNHQSDCQKIGERVYKKHLNKTSSAIQFIFKKLGKGGASLAKVQDITCIAEMLTSYFVESIPVIEKYLDILKQALCEYENKLSNYPHYETSDRGSRDVFELIRLRIFNQKEGVERRIDKCECFLHLIALLFKYGSAIDFIEKGFGQYSECAELYERWTDYDTYGDVLYEVEEHGGLSSVVQRQRCKVTATPEMVRNMDDLRVFSTGTSNTVNPILFAKCTKLRQEADSNSRELHTRLHSNHAQMYEKTWIKASSDTCYNPSYYTLTQSDSGEFRRHIFVCCLHNPPGIVFTSRPKGQARVTEIRTDCLGPINIMPRCRHEHFVIVVIAAGFVGFFCPKLLLQFQPQLEGEEVVFEKQNGEVIELLNRSTALEPLCRMFMTEGTCNIVPIYHIAQGKGADRRPLCQYGGYNVFYTKPVQRTASACSVPRTAGQMARIRPNSSNPQSSGVGVPLFPGGIELLKREVPKLQYFPKESHAGISASIESNVQRNPRTTPSVEVQENTGGRTSPVFGTRESERTQVSDLSPLQTSAIVFARESSPLKVHERSTMISTAGKHIPDRQDAVEILYLRDPKLYNTGDTAHKILQNEGAKARDIEDSVTAKQRQISPVSSSKPAVVQTLALQKPRVKNTRVVLRRAIGTTELLRKRVLMKQMPDKSIIVVGIESSEKIMCLEITPNHHCKQLRTLEQRDLNLPIETLRPLSIHLDGNCNIYVFLTVLNQFGTVLMFMSSKEKPDHVELVRLDLPDECREAYVCHLEMTPGGHAHLVLKNKSGRAWFASCNVCLPLSLS